MRNTDPPSRGSSAIGAPSLVLDDQHPHHATCDPPALASARRHAGQFRSGGSILAREVQTFPRFVTAALAGAAAALALACGTPAASPSSPTPATPAPPAPPSGLSGAWSGSGGDPQGAEKMSWTLTQNGGAVSGTADLAPLDAADGSCASCHKFKSGTITGSLSGSALTMRLTFPSGGD